MKKCKWIKIRTNLKGMLAMESACGANLGIVVSDINSPNYKYTLLGNGFNYCFRCGGKVEFSDKILSNEENLKLTKNCLKITREGDSVIIFPENLYNKNSNVSIHIGDIVDFHKIKLDTILSSAKNLKHFDTHFKNSCIKADYLKLKHKKDEK